MKEFFEAIINMSITGAVVMAVIILVRLILKGMPKKYSYMLWAVAGFRLCCPFSFKSMFSIFNVSPVHAPSMAAGGTANAVDFSTVAQPEVEPSVVANAVGGADGPAAVYTTSSFFDGFIDFIPYIWLVGVVGMLAYAIFSYIRLRKSLATATRLDGSIYQSEAISSPFILGIIKPRIYIPYGVESEHLDYVIAHERYHLRRGDNIIKAIAFVILAMHWFNPLCWVAFTLMNRDMEMSCDEWVLSHNDNIKKQYSTALLSFATEKSLPSPSPLCFSEDSAKSRIKNVLRFKKPTLIISVIAVAVCIVIAVVCMANPKTDANAEERNINVTDVVCLNIGAGMPGIIYADNEKVIFDGTAGVITYDYAERRITDRITWEDINSQKWSEDADYYGVASVSEDGKTIYLTQWGTTGHGENYGYYYDTEKRKIKRLPASGISEPLYTPESINEYEGEYTKYLDSSYITGERGAVVGNKLLYLRANDNWAMRTLQLVTCELGTDNATAYNVFDGISTESIVRELNKMIVSLISIDEHLDREPTPIKKLVTESLGVKYLGDNEQGAHCYKFKYDDSISFSISSSDEYFSSLQGISYSVDGEEYATVNQKDELVFYGKSDMTGELLASIAQSSRQNDYSDVIKDISSSGTKNKYYKSLMKDKEGTIRYIFNQFCKGRQVNAKGTLMRIAMDDIIGGEAIKADCETGQEYFDLWAEHYISLSRKNGVESLKKSSPYAYIFLTEYAGSMVKNEPSERLSFFAYSDYDYRLEKGKVTFFYGDYDGVTKSKVRWVQNYFDAQAVSAQLVIENAGKQIFSKPLEIKDVRPTTYNNDTWDYIIEIDSEFSAKISPEMSTTPQAYVKIIDSNNAEYKISLCSLGDSDDNIAPIEYKSAKD